MQLYFVLRKIALYVSLLSILVGCLPSGNETLVLSYIPYEFHNGWRMGIRCIGQTYDAFIFDFNLVNPKHFLAEGTGEDYSGETRYAVFEGSYNPRTDSLVVFFSLYDEEKERLLRKDKIAILWSTYQNTYQTTIIEYVHPNIPEPCGSEAIIIFTEPNIITKQQDVFSKFKNNQP
jgi:hypothetical protein